MLPAQPNQSLIDGLGVLQALASGGGAIGVREMARRMGLEATRAGRLLQTLAHLGLARQDAERRYAPGPGLHVLAAQAVFGSGLLRRALPVLGELHGLGLTVALGVLWRTRVCYLYHCDPTGDPLAGVGRVGLFPAHRSSIGLVMLAAMSDAEVRRLYRGGENQEVTPIGIDGAAEPERADVAELLAELAVVRRERYGLVGPLPPSVHRSLAVCVGQPPEAALAVAGRFERRRAATLARTLREAARRIDPSGRRSGDR